MSSRRRQLAAEVQAGNISQSEFKQLLQSEEVANKMNEEVCKDYFFVVLLDQPKLLLR